MVSRGIELVQHEPVWDLARERFSLDATSIHGESHWRQVYKNAMEIGSAAGADPEVTGLFAILHDCCRADDGDDLEHGPRAAKFTNQIKPQFLTFLSERQLALLLYAIANHTSPATTSEPTIGSCWDADRLDFGRDGSIPDKKYLSTDAAKRKLEINGALFHDKVA